MKLLKSILATVIFAALYFYFLLPPINVTSADFWVFIIFVILVYYFTSTLSKFPKNIVIVKNLNIKKFLYMPGFVAILVIALLLINVVLSPIFISKAYSKRIIVNENNSFTDDIKTVDLNTLPIIDKASSQKLGDRVMGQMPELVSQFDVSNLYTQINYKNKIVRVTPLEYNDIFKYLSNRKAGIKGYITVNSVNGEVELTKLDKGIHYAESAVFNEDLNRKLRFAYPTKVFGEKNFEIDDAGNPYWIIPVIKYYGINIRKEIKELIVFDPITGKSQLYNVKNVPSWVDHVYSADLIIEQLDDWGKYRSGFINSFIGQKSVIQTTDGYNYTVLNDDVYLYTGITSAVSDESNIGFILTNMRTKETNFYAIAGAEEYSAMSSAEGAVQQMKYNSTFPLLINLNGKATYFVSLKDNAGLVKMYALVDVTNYQKVVAVDSALGLDNLVKKYLANDDIDSTNLSYKNIIIATISNAMIDGDTYYYISDKNGDKYKASILIDETIFPYLKNSDNVKIGYLQLEDLTDIQSIEKN